MRSNTQENDDDWIKARSSLPHPRPRLLDRAFDHPQTVANSHAEGEVGMQVQSYIEGMNPKFIEEARAANNAAPWVGEGVPAVSFQVASLATRVLPRVRAAVCDAAV